MKRQMGGLSKKAMAVLLSAALVVGMIWTTPVIALAQGNGEFSADADGRADEHDAEPEKGEAVSESTEQEEAESRDSGSEGGSSESEGGGSESGSSESEGSGSEGGSGESEGNGTEGGSSESEGNGTEGGSGSGSLEGGGSESGSSVSEGSGTKSGNGSGAEGQESENGGPESVSGNDAGMTEQTAEEDGMIMTLAASRAAAPGSITSNQEWEGQTLAAGTYTISSGVTVTVSGKLTITGNVTINGGGTLRWSSAGGNVNALEVGESAQLTLENVTLDGNKITFSRSALLLRGNVIFKSGTVIQNFKTTTGSGSGAGAKGVIAVYNKGVLNIYDGVTITGNQCDSGIIALYQFDTESGLADSTATVNMYGGTITGNTVSNANLGVVWNWCGNLNISGGTVTAEGGEYAVHTQGNNKSYNATTVISGGTFTGMQYGAVCAGKDSGNRSVIKITGGSFTGKIAATVNYGTIEIRGGVYNGTEYALSSSGSGALEVYGGEFIGGTKAYSGTISTNTVKVIVGESKDTASKWDKSTNLNIYKYVAIGELEQPLPAHAHDSIVFTPWESADSLPSAAGDYYLTEDIVLTQVTDSCAWEAPSGTTNLCLNGHKVTYSGSDAVSAIRVGSGATLNLYDCNGSNGNHSLTSPATGENVTISGGLITGSGQKDVVGSGIRVYGGGTCNLYGGSIAGFSDTPGSNASHGAVRVEGTFHMYGGAITHNRSGCGGGVNICRQDNGDAYFCLHGGSISYNYADFDDGGGICINDTGSFEMTGGEIRGNRAKSGGGGIHWYNNGNIGNTVCLSGGVIAENSTGGEAGGAVRFDKNPWQQFFVSGDINITGNKNKDGKESNIYLEDGYTIGVDSSDLGLGSGAAIGVTAESAPTEQSPIAVTGHNKGDYSKYFQSDNPAYEIRNDSDTVKLILPHSHTPVKHEKVSADCTNPGTGEYWKCEGTTGCGRMFSDQACTAEISEIPVIPALGHSYDDSSDMVCNDCGNDRTKLDKTPPTGSITIDGRSWEKLSESISFDLFFNKEKQAVIRGQDTAGDVCSGVDKVYYYVSDTALSGEAVKALGNTQWKEGTSVTLTPDRKCVIYAKITDKAGNAAYLSTGGLMLDATAPVITGITEGEVYRAPQAVTVTDANLQAVTVNGAEVTLTDSSFTLGAASGVQIIVATDKAGNCSTVTVTIKTAAENVSDAKAVVERALEKAAVSNDTTVDAIRSAIDAALKNAGIGSGDVTVTLKDFEKTEATKEAEGSLRGTIAIASSQDSSVTDSVTLNKTIPAIGGGSIPDEGEIDQKVETSGNAPVTQIKTSKEELAEKVLTEDEKKDVAAGTKITIVLDVKDASASVSEADKDLVQKALSENPLAKGYTIGQYLDVSLYKLTGDNKEDKDFITETSVELTITFRVPEDLKNAESGKAKNYAVIRLHEGTDGIIETTVLEDQDQDPDTITITTDRFSSYTIVYKVASNPGTGGNTGTGDGSGTGNGGSGNGGGAGSGGSIGTDGSSAAGNNVSTVRSGNAGQAEKDREPKTGDSTHIELYATLAMIAGFTYLLLYFADRGEGMTEEAKQELVSRLIGWAKKGGKGRRLLALAAIFILLVYYHSIGKAIPESLDLNRSSANNLL